MRTSLLFVAITLAGLAGVAHAEEMTCKGTITSVQGEGLIARTHRFQVSDITGKDVAAVIGKSVKIAREKQNRAARMNPGGNFRNSSELDLQCVQGTEKSSIRRTIQTSP